MKVCRVWVVGFFLPFVKIKEIAHGLYTVLLLFTLLSFRKMGKDWATNAITIAEILRSAQGSFDI